MSKEKEEALISQEEQREQIIQNIADSLRENPFTFEFKVKKNPKGIRIIYEMTQEEMDKITKQVIDKSSKITKA